MTGPPNDQFSIHNKREIESKSYFILKYSLKSKLDIDGIITEDVKKISEICKDIKFKGSGGEKPTKVAPTLPLEKQTDEYCKEIEDATIGYRVELQQLFHEDQTISFQKLTEISIKYDATFDKAEYFKAVIIRLQSFLKIEIPLDEILTKIDTGHSKEFVDANFTDGTLFKLELVICKDMIYLKFHTKITHE
jgi:hypothetical protein